MMGQAAIGPPPSSAGFPANYPYAYSAPLPSAILRPLQQPLYDTESYGVGVPAADILFFQRQLGQTQALAGTGAKTAAETNLAQPGQLANPLEFSLFGFAFEIEPDVTLADFNIVYTTGAFTFTYTGNRVYLQIPLLRIPQGVAPEGFTAVADDSGVGALVSLMVHNGVGHISNYYKFTIGRSALRIRPTESFQVAITYPGAATANMGATTRSRVFLLGLQWTPL